MMDDWAPLQLGNLSHGPAMMSPLSPSLSACRVASTFHSLQSLPTRELLCSQRFLLAPRLAAPFHNVELSTAF